MAKLYRISFIVVQEMVKVMTSLIIDRVKGFTCTKVDPSEKARNNSGRDSGGTVSDARWTGKSAQAILDHMAKNRNKDYHHTELAKLLPAVGISEASISPILSLMYQHGKIARVGKGKYRLPPEK